MITKYVPELVTLIDGNKATKELVDIIYGCLLDLSQTRPDALTELVKKCRDDTYKLWGKTLGELAQVNLVKLTGESYNDYVPIILAMMDGQTENFKPVHPAPYKK